MDKKRKINRYISGGILALVITTMIIKWVVDSPYRKNIPSLPDMQSFAAPLKQQITSTSQKAKRNPSAKNLGMLGMVYHSNAYYDEAARCYQLAIKRKGSSWNWNYYLGFLNREMGKPEAAVEHFNTVLQKNPMANHAWFYAGEEYQNLGNNKQAEMAFDKIANLQVESSTGNGVTRTDYFPLSVYAKFQLARIYMDTERMNKAERTLQKIIKDYRSFGPAYRLLGNVYSIKGDQALSERYTVRANDLAIYSPPVDTLIDRLSLLSRSELYLLKKIDEAEKGFYPEWAMKLVNHGLIYLPDNKYLISKAIKLYLMIGLGNQALPLLEKHLAFFHDDFNEISSVAYLLYAKGLYAQSLAYYRLARQIKPDEIPIQTSIILCLWNTGNKKQALDSTRQWLDNNQVNSKILTEGVGLLLNLKEEALTKVYFSKLKNLAPQDAEVMTLSGKLAEAGGNIPEAIDWYESAFRKKPEDLSNVRFLVNLLIQQKLWEKSIACLRKALTVHPNEPYLLEKLGTMLVLCPDSGLRNITEGKEFSERAFIHITSEPSTWISAGRSLAAAYAALGDKRNAYSTINMTINLAKQENVPEAYIEELEKLLRAFKM